MTEPDYVARWIAGLALAVAALGLLVSWLNYRRSGVRVKVTAQRAIYSTYAGEAFEWPIVDIRVANTGHADVQVSSVWFDVRADKAIVERNPGGPTLPRVLAGNSSEAWNSELKKLAEVALGPDRDRVQVRAVVQLAGDRLVRSKWLTLTREDAS